MSAGSSSRTVWLAVSLAVSVPCVLSAIGATFWLLVAGAFFYAIGKGGPVG